jgi:elongation factor Tu
VGRIERGVLRQGDEAEVVGLAKQPSKVQIASIEMFQKSLPEAAAGDDVGVLLAGVDHSHLRRGQVLATPGSITTPGAVESVIHLYSREEGGRGTPLLAGETLRVSFGPTDVPGALSLLDQSGPCEPGALAAVTVQLPEETPLALEVGMRFGLIEAGRSIGMGVVTGLLK